MLSARDIAFVGCRLLALYFVYVALVSVPHSFYALSSAFGAGQSRDIVHLFYQTASWLSLASPILSLAMALLLWLGASWLSREVAEGAPEGTSTWSPQSLLSVGVVLLGLVLVSFALPQIALYLLFIADGAADAADFQVAVLASEVVQTIVGIGLVLGSGGVADMIARMRRWSPAAEK